MFLMFLKMKPRPKQNTCLSANVKHTVCFQKKKKKWHLVRALTNTFFLFSP